MNETLISFWKLSGSGNDFVCIDNTDGRFDALLADADHAAGFARAVCRRGHGVGADGVIFASVPEIEGVADVGATFLEADGSTCELCGNGTACFVDFVISSGVVDGSSEIKILTPAGVVTGKHVDAPYVRVCIPSPEDTRFNLTLDVRGRTFLCDATVVGVPHLVAYVDDLDRLDVERYGRALRHHPRFQPRGTNVNFVQILDHARIAVRTFEFGVEGETFACGTGSSAAAILTTLREAWNGPLRNADKPVEVRSRAGRILRVYFVEEPDGHISDVCLETPVQRIYAGTFSEEFLTHALPSARPADRPCKCCSE